jgi:chemotaxis protein MotA
MFIIIGIVVVFGAVVGGFLMEHGNLRVPMQPAELVTIGGAAIGTVLIADPLYIVKKILGGVAGAFGGSKFSKQRYPETLKMMFELFSRARRDGLMALETDSDNPEQSKIFSKYPNFLKDHHALAFVCDSIRMASSGGIEPFDADQMIENDLDVHHQQATMPVAALSTVADSLPGLGIVAAVLGVVITMGSLGGRAKKSGRRLPPAGGHISRDSIVLGIGRAVGRKHVQDCCRRTRLLPGAARDDRGVYERDGANHGGGNRAPRDPGKCTASVPRSGSVHQG